MTNPNVEFQTPNYYEVKINFAYKKALKERSLKEKTMIKSIVEKAIDNYLGEYEANTRKRR